MTQREQPGAEAGLDLLFVQAVLDDDEISVQHLLDRGVEPSSWGNSGICIACQRGNTEIVGLLLGCGTVVDGRDDDCLLLAIKGRNRDVIDLLLSNGAWHDCAMSCAIAQEDHETLSKLLLVNDHDEELLEEALIAAVTQGSREGVRLLLTVTSVDPRVVLDGALQEARQRGFSSIVRQLEVACVCTELAGKGSWA